MSSCSFTQHYSSLIFLGRAHRSLLPGEILLVTWCCRSAHTVSQSPKNGLQRLSNCSASQKQGRDCSGIQKMWCLLSHKDLVKTQPYSMFYGNTLIRKTDFHFFSFPDEAWSPVQRHVVCCSFTWCCAILLEQVSFCQAWSLCSPCSLNRSPQLPLIQPLPCHSTPVPLGRTSLSPGRPCVWGILPGLNNSGMASPLSQPSCPLQPPDPSAGSPAANRWLCSLQGDGAHSEDPGDLIPVSMCLVTYTGHRWSQNALNFTGKGQTTPCRHLSLLCDCSRGWGLLRFMRSLRIWALGAVIKHILYSYMVIYSYNQE